MVTTEVAAEDAGRYGVVQVGDDDRITDYAYKPDEPATTTVANEVFVVHGRPGTGTAGELARRTRATTVSTTSATSCCRDLVDDGLAREHRCDGYWRDVGTVQAYWEAHQELPGRRRRRSTSTTRSGRCTRGRAAHGAARIRAGAEVENSLIVRGARVAGRCAGSVLSPGVVVEAGAEVVDSVLLPGSRRARRARCARAILDDGVEVGPEARVGGGSEGEVALVGRPVELSAGTVVPPGGRLPEED